MTWIVTALLVSHFISLYFIYALHKRSRETERDFDAHRRLVGERLETLAKLMLTLDDWRNEVLKRVASRSETLPVTREIRRG